jgi:hypothetical protein
MMCHYLLDNEGIPLLYHLRLQLDAAVHHNQNDVSFAEDIRISPLQLLLAPRRIYDANGYWVLHVASRVNYFQA